MQTIHYIILIILFTGNITLANNKIKTIGDSKQICLEGKGTKSSFLKGKSSIRLEGKGLRWEDLKAKHNKTWRKFKK